MPPIDTNGKLDQFTEGYIEAALWSSTGPDDEPLDKEHSWLDIAPETLEAMKADCKKFQETHRAVLEDVDNCLSGSSQYSSDELAGHDFWLTRNGHGAGFWDGDWKEPAATELTDGSKRFGSYDLYIGDDGKVYGS